MSVGQYQTVFQQRLSFWRIGNNDEPAMYVRLVVGLWIRKRTVAFVWDVFYSGFFFYTKVERALFQWQILAWTGVPNGNDKLSSLLVHFRSLRGYENGKNEAKTANSSDKRRKRNEKNDKEHARRSASVHARKRARRGPRRGQGRREGEKRAAAAGVAAEGPAAVEMRLRDAELVTQLCHVSPQMGKTVTCSSCCVIATWFQNGSSI